MLNIKKLGSFAFALLLTLGLASGSALASEIDLNVPSLDVGYNIFGYAITGSQIAVWYGRMCSGHDFWLV